MAFKEAMAKAKPVILEPIMKVEVVTPEDYYGDIVGDLNRRRGQIVGMEDSDLRQGRDRRSAAGRDVPVLDLDALDEPGPRDVHDGILEVHGSAVERRRCDHEEDLRSDSGADVTLSSTRQPFNESELEDRRCGQREV